MSDPIQAMTAELAADPASLVFLELGEALRQRRQFDAAAKVVRAGVARYPDLVDAHDLLGRILSDRGDASAAEDAWRNGLRIDSHHGGANKGLAFLLYRTGDLGAALAHLERAAEAMPEDAGVLAAIERVSALMAERLKRAVARQTPSGGQPMPAEAAASAPAPTPPAEDAGVGNLDEVAEEREVFAGLEGASDGLLLLDKNGLRLGGGLRSPKGQDVSDAVAAHLSGVSREAARAAKLLSLGEFESLAAESADGNLYLVAPTADTALLTVRDRSVPVGRLALMAERAARAARTWLERMA